MLTGLGLTPAKVVVTVQGRQAGDVERDADDKDAVYYEYAVDGGVARFVKLFGGWVAL